MAVHKIDPAKVKVHNKAQQRAIKYLCHKYNDEYRAKYREFVIEMGGKVHPTNAERIKNLKEQIAKLESEGV